MQPRAATDGSCVICLEDFGSMPPHTMVKEHAPRVFKHRQDRDQLQVLSTHTRLSSDGSRACVKSMLPMAGCVCLKRVCYRAYVYKIRWV